MGGMQRSSFQLSREKLALLERMRERENLAPSLDAKITPRRGKGPAPLSFAQQRLWLLDQIEPGNPAYNIPVAVRLEGPLDVQALARSLSEIVRRHEVLRSALGVHEGGPSQPSQPSQIAGSPAPVALEVVEIGALDAEAGEKEVRRLAAEMARRPFDLAHGPLLRALLMRLGEYRHVLVLTVHHIASDGWSRGILIRELSRLYAAFAAGEPSPLPELPIQYADFAAWEREKLQGEALAEHLGYWRERLRDLPALELPADHPRPWRQSFRGRQHAWSLPLGLSAQLRELSQREGATLFMVLLAAFDLLLSRYCNQEEVVVGFPVANRPRLELQDLIGFFVNTLVLRVSVAGDPSFRELLGRVREASLEAQDHQAVPFDKLVEELRPERNASHTPFFQVVFTYQEGTAMPVELGGLRIEPLEIPSETTKFDLTFSMAERGGALVGVVEYSADLFEPETVERLVDHYETLLTALAADPGQRISSLPLLTPAERELVLETWSGTAVEPLLDRPVPALIAARAAEAPDALAVAGAGEALTYGELDRRANQLARTLRRLGVTSESRAGVCARPTPGMVAGLLAVLKAGGAYVPVDPDYPADRLRYILEDAGIAVLLSQKDLLPALPELGVPVVCLDEMDQLLAGESEAPPDIELAAANLAYTIYTSGSTGRPKGVEVPHGGLLNLVDWHLRTYRLTPADRSTQIASVAFDASVWEIWPPLVAGASLHIPDEETRAVPVRLGAWLREQEITICFLPTPVAEALLESGAGADLPRLKTILTGGDRLTRRPRAGEPELVNHYGPTENTVVATFTPVKPEGGGDDRLPPIGRPITNSRVYLLDGALQPVPPGVPGELCIGGASLARGYLRRPGLTAERFVPDPFGGSGSRLYRTGDLVRWRPDGDIEFLGRIDDQVKIRGFRIELAEIETVLREHPAVREAVVVVRDVQGSGKRLAAYYVPGEPVEPRELQAFLGRTLPPYMVPNTFVALEAMPLTRHGKIDRRALPEPPAAAPGSAAPPRNPVEARLVEIWKRLLGVRELGIDDDFFELGGHSLKATELLSLVHHELGVELALRELFEAPTVAGLAQLLESRPPASLPPLEPTPERERYVLSHAQRRLWILNQFEEESTAYNIPNAFLLTGDVDADRLERAFQRLIARHEVLRTVFEVVDGAPWQRVLPGMPFQVDRRDLSGEADPEAAAREIAVADADTPFDLARGPLVRVLLLRLGVRRHLLVFNIHHIVCDGWSMGVIYNEVAAAYNGRELPALPVQYRDYSEWLGALLSGPRLEDLRTYWRERLAGAPDGIELPLDRSRPPVQTFNGRRVVFGIPREAEEGLRRASAAADATLFMGLLASLYALLYRYTGQPDLTVGSPIAGRQHPLLGGLVGFFVNTLALREQVEPAEGFAGLLSRVRETALAAYENQLYPFDRLVEELGFARDLSKPPVFNVMLAHNNTSSLDASARLEGLEIATFQAEDFNMAKFDLIFFIDEVGGRLRTKLEYNLDLFDEATAERLRDGYLALLDSLAAAPGRAVRDLGVLSAAEREQVTRGFQGPPLALEPVTLQELFQQAAARYGEDVAVVWGGAEMTYAELNRRANRVAHHLRERHGVRGGEPVGIMVERSFEMIAGVLGILKAGGGYVAIDPSYPRERILHMLEDSHTRVLLTDRTREDLLSAYSGRVVDLVAEWPEMALSPDSDPPIASQPSDTAYVIYTSGSTGTPNGAMLTHSLLANLLAWQQRMAGIGGRLRCLQFTSLNFCVSFQEIFGTLTQGGTLVLIDEIDRQDVSYLMRFLSEQRIELLFLPFSYLNFLFNESAAWGPGFEHRLKHIVTAGEQLKISSSMQAFLNANPGLRLHNHYGSSEMHVVTAFTLDAGRALRYPVPPVGSPIAATSIYILDRHLNLVPTGVWGEIFVRAGGVMAGYIHNSALTAWKLMPHPFSEAPGDRLYRTGDLGRWVADGTIEYRGRIDSQVKVRGFRVELGEIESVLLALDEVKDCVVVVRHEGAERRSLVAYVVLGAGAPADLERISAVLKERLPQYMVPLLVPLDRLPLMPNGKVDREKLPDPAELGVTSEAVLVEPRNEVEHRLAEIWCELLGLERVSVTESFFNLGGHSLKATQIIARVYETWGVRVPLIEIFQEPTIEHLARLVAAGLEEAQRTRGVLDKVSEALRLVEMMSDQELESALRPESKTT